MRREGLFDSGEGLIILISFHRLHARTHRHIPPRALLADAWRHDLERRPAGMLLFDVLGKVKKGDRFIFLLSAIPCKLCAGERRYPRPLFAPRQGWDADSEEQRAAVSGAGETPTLPGKAHLCSGETL